MVRHPCRSLNHENIDARAGRRLRAKAEQVVGTVGRIAVEYRGNTMAKVIPLRSKALPPTGSAPAAAAGAAGDRGRHPGALPRWLYPGPVRAGMTEGGLFYRIARNLAQLCGLWVLALSRRLIDVGLAFVLLAALTPVIVPLVVYLFLVQGRAFKRTRRLGRWSVPFGELAFALGPGRLSYLLSRLGIMRAPALYNILRGEMAFVGPAAARPGSEPPWKRSLRPHYDIRPGLVVVEPLTIKALAGFAGEPMRAEPASFAELWLVCRTAFRRLPAALRGDVDDVAALRAAGWR